MQPQWTSKALADLVRLHEFLAVLNKPAAARMLKSLMAAPASLVANPRIGEKLEEFEPREVRRILVATMRCAMKQPDPRSIFCACGIRARNAQCRQEKCAPDRTAQLTTGTHER
ncbi:type II toxin-antitoxin system RelE/ParE family toxin [Massilia sp. CCM 9029]|uniref:type II toxin-antitoxin system RelE/ParE family toxin n=1 Tax=Massilia scottii TaxID=3057166 RepID=UPI002796A300|nr:type II toxin-antitoxin system RelE/ParE family toxin [Massilia sp. CCM 9029]MDQ1832493.1 type II toxin-antitoxin system RelE/ParE family toxin [Massilia sp. CCM 9029]